MLTDEFRLKGAQLRLLNWLEGQNIANIDFKSLRETIDPQTSKCGVQFFPQLILDIFVLLHSSVTFIRFDI